MPKIRFQHTYNNIISLENLLEAWKEFVRGKRSRKDVQEFERDLMTNLIALHRELAAKKYSHSAYQHFKIADPKPREIQKVHRQGFGEQHPDGMGAQMRHQKVFRKHRSRDSIGYSRKIYSRSRYPRSHLDHRTEF